AQVAVGDLFCVARETSHSNDSLDPIVDGRQPPTSRAAHAHACRCDPLLVHLGPRFQIVDQALFLAKHHAPETSALPDVELEQAQFLRVSTLVEPGTSRALTNSFPVETGVNGGHDVSPFGQQWADELAALGVGADALLGAAMPVQSKDCGD